MLASPLRHASTTPGGPKCGGVLGLGSGTLVAPRAKTLLQALELAHDPFVPRDRSAQVEQTPPYTLLPTTQTGPVLFAEDSGQPGSKSLALIPSKAGPLWFSGRRKGGRYLARVIRDSQIPKVGSPDAGVNHAAVDSGVCSCRS